MTRDQRAAILASLAAGCTLPQSVAGAFGKRIPARAWVELREMRREDAEMAEACEAAEKREAEGAKPRNGPVAGSIGGRGGAAPEVHRPEVDGSVHDRAVAGLVQGGSGRPTPPEAAEGAGSAVGAVVHAAASGVLGDTGGGSDLRRPDRELPLKDNGPGPKPEAVAAVEERPMADARAKPTTLTRAASRPQWVAAGKASAGLDREAIERLAPPRSKRASEATDDGAPDWETIRKEAAELADGPFGWILWQERRLAGCGHNFPALPPFSLHALEEFFLSGKRWMLVMAGRGFGKSTFASRFATAVGFGVARRAAPGPAWVCPLVSVLPVDADRRLEDIQQILLHAYGQEIKIAAGKSMIAAKDADKNSLAWIASASTIGNVSGPSSFAAFVDEEEKILHGRAGGIVGSLAYTFRSRPHVYGLRVSSAMGIDGTLARACEKGNDSLTNYVATLGPFLSIAVEGLLAVAAWEESRGAVDAGKAIRAHAESLTVDSWQIPTWLGHPTIGRPSEDAPWGPGDAAIATRIEAEATDERHLDGLAPWRYWLRECASVPTGGEASNEWGGGDDAGCGEPSRYEGTR